MQDNILCKMYYYNLADFWISLKSIYDVADWNKTMNALFWYGNCNVMEYKLIFSIMDKYIIYQCKWSMCPVLW